MIIRQLPRRGGKTTYAVKRLRAGAYVVVMNHRERARIIEEFKIDPDMQRQLIVAAPDALRPRGLGEWDERLPVIIDNLDMVLAVLLGRAVDEATL